MFGVGRTHKRSAQIFDVGTTLCPSCLLFTCQGLIQPIRSWYRAKAGVSIWESRRGYVKLHQHLLFHRGFSFPLLLKYLLRMHAPEVTRPFQSTIIESNFDIVGSKLYSFSQNVEISLQNWNRNYLYCRLVENFGLAQKFNVLWQNWSYEWSDKAS